MVKKGPFIKVIYYRKVERVWKVGLRMSENETYDYIRID